MKTKKLISTILTLFVLFFTSCAKKANDSLSVALYKVSDLTAKGLEQTIQELYKDSNREISFIIVNDEKELKNLVHSKNVQLVFTSAGYNQRTCLELASKKSSLPNISTSDITSSVYQSIIFDEKAISAVPILTDNYEIDINLYDFKVSNVEAINTWNDVERFLLTQKRSDTSPVYFAGANSIDFFDMLGAFCEAVDGPSYYLKALEILDKGGNPQEVAFNLLGSPTSPMVNTATLLKSYFRKGFISPDSFALTPKDLERYAQEDFAKMMIMSLSQHRTINYDAIRRYSSAYMPSTQSASFRTFTANILYAIPVNPNTESQNLINKLLYDENQTKLSRNTGLAPITRNCMAPDKQADDARYWIAATNTPFAGLGHDTKLSVKDLDKIKDYIKNILLYE